MPKKKDNPNATWSDVKAKLADFDRAARLTLVQDLYGASKGNQAFLHARFGLGADALSPYKALIAQSIAPDVLRGHPISVSKARKAITDYKRAVGSADGMAELTTFYCEEAMSLLAYCGMDDEGYFSALIRVFGEALGHVVALPAEAREAFLVRLREVRNRSNDVGWGVESDMAELLHQRGFDD